MHSSLQKNPTICSLKPTYIVHFEFQAGIVNKKFISSMKKVCFLCTAALLFI